MIRSGLTRRILRSMLETGGAQAEIEFGSLALS